MDDLIKVTPDKERAKSLLEMTIVRMKAIELMKSDSFLFSSKIIEEYYEIMLELITAVMCIDGYKTRSDAAGAHIVSINYMRNYKEFNALDMHLLDDMRKKRSGIKYYGRHVDSDYIKRNLSAINAIIKKLKIIVEKGIA